MNFITLLDYVGTFAFAISGIRLASAKHFDWFGAYVVGFVTAVGGGTLRDLLLGLPPFWMQNVSYLVVSGFAFLFVVGLRKYVIRLNNTFFIFDAVGLGLFTVVGIQKSIAVGYPMWVGIIMGTLTGAAGGMLRDVLLNEVPLIFRKDIYAIACICGGLIYYLCMYLDLPAAPTQFIAACSVILIRILAVRYGISLPADKFPVKPFLPYNNTLYYGLTINPVNSEVYIADAIDYVQNGVVLRYSPDGELLDEFYVGIIPGAFCWR